MHKLASLLAEIFSPFILCGILISTIALATDPHPLPAICVALGFLVFVPQALSIRLARSGKTTDRFVQVREQRTQLYVMTLVSVVIGCLLLNLLPTSRDVQLIMNTAAATLVVAMLLNFIIKVSIHALMAALFGIVLPVYLGGATLYFVVGALIWAVTVWARLHNKRHSALELVLGTLVGGIVALFYLSALN
ncbi:hypothetical protein [Rothia terrae]|uniref:Phosphatase PAP2 family protein n=1 Tax=Rothia terrae TaxID=396015 RepID=A0A7H2BD79_9MICC|nr:hypothetical protein [Rothia terrae]QNV37625.1 hypothetical protein IDM49_10540 [Rothia terrae]